jgi:hypothetical protein
MANNPKPLLVLYASLMEEIKQRIDVTVGITRDRFNLPALAAYELYWLELRMICELIALSWLVAHGDIPSSYSRRLRTTYKPGEILKELEALHPAFYPRPFNTPAGDLTSVELLESGYITKDELISLHGKSGDVLHKGRLKDLDRKRALDFANVDHWQGQIVSLLDKHYISLSDKKTSYCVLMKEAPNETVGIYTVKRTAASPTWDDYLGGKHR